MSTEKFDEILDQCLTMMQAGASIDDCVARYSQHADELRAQLQTAQTLWDAKPTAQPEPAAQAKGRSRLLTAVGESSQVQVSEGELFLGWRLLEIHPDKVVFGRDEETVTLELIYKAQPAPEPPARQRP